MKPARLCFVPLAAALSLAAFPPALHAQQPSSALLPVGGAGADPYRQARTPTLTVSAGTGATGGVNARLAKLSALAGGGTPSSVVPAVLQLLGGLFSDVSLGYLDGSGKPPATATVSMQFAATWADTNVWVQPMDGGSILGQDANGKPVSLPDGTFVALDSTGAATFSFQAPARTGRFQVLIRCQNVSSSLPFIVLDPSVDN